jgi:methyl coenzyme M reductase subunit D
MKTLPAPVVPGNTKGERFDKAVRKTFTVSKEEMERRVAEGQG